MKEMIKKVKERREGFTMAELLIVVAIIAVLVAIAIPVFNSQLGKAQASTDAANIRSGYAVVSAQVITEDEAPADGATYYLMADGTVAAATVSGSTVTAPTGTLYGCKGDSSKLEANSVVGNAKIVTGTPGANEIKWDSNDNVRYVWHAGSGSADGYIQIEIVSA